jgi:DNA polymerase III gamma/tau subunit
LLGVVPEEVLDALVEGVAAGSAERVLELVHRLLAEGRNLQHFCRETIQHFRNLLVARVCGAESELIAATPDQRPHLARVAEKFTEEDLTRFFQILLVTDDDLRRKPDPRLHLEMGLLRLVNAARLAPLEQVLAELNQGAGAPRQTEARAPRAKAPERTMAAEARARGPLPAGPPRIVAKAAGELNGIEAAQVEAIKAAILTQQKFLGELVEHVSRWELASGEIRLYFPTESRALAEMLQARDPMEKLRTITSQVVGQPLRVCVKLETAPSASGAGRTSLGSPELKGQFEQDPIVRAMLERFGGRISEVRRRNED